MATASETFFTAWAEQDASKRDAAIDAAMGKGFTLYADPRTPKPITDIAALKDYVGMFSQMAPGMPVSVANESNVLHFARVAVRFGEGEKSQLGQYVIDLDETGKITRMVGFVGLGSPE